MRLSICILIQACLATDRPNVLFIMLDDMGWSNVGFHNPSVLSTPFLDAMSKSENAMELTNMYTTPRCSPSRAAFLTGVYPYRYGMGSSALKVSDLPLGLNLNMTLLPEIMKKEGNYSTHMIGKWHLGHADVAELPHSRGFDSFYGFYEAEADYFTHTRSVGRGKPGGHAEGRHVYRNETGPVDVSGRYMTRDLTREAKKTLLTKNGHSKFIYLPYQAPHYPVSAPEGTKKKLAEIYAKAGIATNDKMLTFHGAMHVIDQGIKELWNAAKLLERETIIVVTTDNGGGGFEGGCNFPYRGVKQRFLEGGIKATTLVMSTQRTFPKRRDTDMMYVLDWFPTVLGMAGIDAPSENGGFSVDGVDFSSRFGQTERTVAEPRDRFIVGVVHEFVHKKWKMRYCARYKQFKYCNYHQSITAGHCDVYPGNNFIPEVSRSNYTTPKYAERVHKLGSPGRTQNQHMTTSRQMFYNLEKDPFEIENIVNQRSEREIIDEISKWAEAQIGRPVLPIVGVTNEAYQSIVHHAGRMMYGQPHQSAKQGDFVEKYMLHTKRVVKTNMCQRYTGMCEVKDFSVSGWHKSAIETDFKLITEYWNERKDSKIDDWTLKCGEFCCSWRQSQGLPCFLNYSDTPFQFDF